MARGGPNFGGVSQVRQSPNRFFDVLTPPTSFTVAGFPNVNIFGQGGEGDHAGAPIRGIITQIQETTGYGQIRGGVVSSNPFMLFVQGGNQSIFPPADPPTNFVNLQTYASIVDPATGLHAVDFVVDNTRRLERVKVDHLVGGSFGPIFEMQVHMIPFGS